MQVTKYDLDAQAASPHLRELRRVRDALSATLRFRQEQRLDAQDRDARLKALLENVEGTSQ